MTLNLDKILKRVGITPEAEMRIKMKIRKILSLIINEKMARFVKTHLIYRLTRYEWSVDISAGANAVRGTLFISAYGEGETDSKPLKHTTVYVNGPYYNGMEDNDIRGFLDGSFRFGWNQPTQIHVRAGRREKGGLYGEQELFRILLRWHDIELPPCSRILNAQLKFFIEEGPQFPVTVYLYNLKKDWDPGKGGIMQNNLSQPKEGEVWWCDLAYKKKSWGLPGAGFSSDEHHGADSSAMPLAYAKFQPGDRSLRFSSTELTKYIGKRISEHRPLLFLLKLSDDHEDSPGSMLTLYSGNHGDNRNIVRRPSLLIEWDSMAEIRNLKKNVFLEHGRNYLLRFNEIDDAKVIKASFKEIKDFEKPIIEIRNNYHDEGNSEWQRVYYPILLDKSSIEIRLTAAIDPIILGNTFNSELRDTWVITGKPEKQHVPWTFVSPYGKKHIVKAVYQGDHLWSVSFRPNEIGRWQYWWTQKFSEKQYSSAIGTLDVLGGDIHNIKKQLALLSNKIRHSKLKPGKRRFKEFGIEFMRLERAALQSLTPEMFTSASGKELQDLLCELRILISGRNLPGTLPLF